MPFPSTLSEKAKGKQKAPEPSIDSSPLQASGEESHRALVIRFTEGIPDLVVDVRKQDAVRDVKRTVRRICIYKIARYLTH